jgi:hypothetical protein
MLGPRRRRGRPGLIGAAARTAVVAGTASAVAGKVSHTQQQKYAAEAAAEAPPPAAAAPPPAAAAPPPAAPPPAAPAAGGDDMIDKLKQLGELHEQGILTDEEFAAQKAKILG